MMSLRSAYRAWRATKKHFDEIDALVMKGIVKETESETLHAASLRFSKALRCLGWAICQCFVDIYHGLISPKRLPELSDHKADTLQQVRKCARKDFLEKAAQLHQPKPYTRMPSLDVDEPAGPIWGEAECFIIQPFAQVGPVRSKYFTGYYPLSFPMPVWSENRGKAKRLDRESAIITLKQLKAIGVMAIAVLVEQ